MHVEDGIDVQSLDGTGFERVTVEHTDKVESKPDVMFDSVLETSDFMKVLRSQLECLKVMKEHVIDVKHKENKSEEWQLLAQVLDRLFLVLYLVILTFASLGIILRSFTGGNK